MTRGRPRLVALLHIIVIITSVCNTASEHSLTREQLRVLNEPVRVRILEELCQEPMSVQDLREVLEGDLPSNLYYHVDKLLDAGLIRLEHTEQRRGATEKYYRAIASRFSAGAILGPGVELSEAVRSSFESVMSRLGRALDKDQPDEPIVTQMRIRTTAAKARKLRERLKAWIADAAAADGKGDTELITLQVLFDDPER